MAETNSVRLSDVIAPSYAALHQDVKAGAHTEYWLKGGRSSLKSSFISGEIVLGMMKDRRANALALRKTENTLRGSVYEQLLWAIEMLGVSDYWYAQVSPMQLIYKPTGQRILFRGADDPKKLKSTKVRNGYVKYIWYEELDEFHGMDEIRTINQTFVRGGDQFCIFYSYNPPRAINAWVNEEARQIKPDRIVHHSTYLDAPRHWLGEAFYIAADHLKAIKPDAFRHEYMGEETGTGGEVFDNVRLETITDDAIKQFDNIRRGLDWGYATDPLAYLAMQYDAKRRTLFIYHEIFKVRMSNRAAAEEIRRENPWCRDILADSAEPKSIAEVNELGLNVRGARKGPDSVDYGIKWLQDLEAIVIDPERCPNAAREFLGYELEPDEFGGYKARFPDKNNHTIDAARYGCSEDMRIGGVFNVKI